MNLIRKVEKMWTDCCRCIVFSGCILISSLSTQSLLVYQFHFSFSLTDQQETQNSFFLRRLKCPRWNAVPESKYHPFLVWYIFYANILQFWRTVPASITAKFWLQMVSSGILSNVYDWFEENKHIKYHCQNGWAAFSCLMSMFLVFMKKREGCREKIND